MLNTMHLHGRLVADPELRTTQSGTAVCSFRVAWSEKYKETEIKLFLSCTAWRGTGEAIAKYFTKGKEIVVSGSLASRDWTDKDGNKRTSIEMTVSSFDFCGSKGDSSGGAASDEYSEIDEDDGDLPF